MKIGKILNSNRKINLNQSLLLVFVIIGLIIIATAVNHTVYQGSAL